MFSKSTANRSSDVKCSVVVPSSDCAQKSSISGCTFFLLKEIHNIRNQHAVSSTTAAVGDLLRPRRLLYFSSAHPLLPDQCVTGSDGVGRDMVIVKEYLGSILIRLNVCSPSTLHRSHNLVIIIPLHDDVVTENGQNDTDGDLGLPALMIVVTTSSPLVQVTYVYYCVDRQGSLYNIL